MKKVPLTWLQAFEAAGRTGSFKAAAVELNVSASNISHQIRNLETYLQTLLFSRNGRQVKLTEEGKNYLPALSMGFQSIREASTSTSYEVNKKQLRIGAFPFLANEIIAPNIKTLSEVTLNSEISLYSQTETSALTHVDPGRRLDLVIRYGTRNARFTGLVAHKLADVSLVPIVGPNAPEIDSPEEFLAQPLIRVIGPFQGWQQWVEAFSVNAPVQNFELQTDSFHSAMMAVARGEGVCLGVLPYLAPWIRDGRVRALTQWQLPLKDQAAYAVFAPFQSSNERFHQCIAWIQQHLAVEL